MSGSLRFLVIFIVTMAASTTLVAYVATLQNSAQPSASLRPPHLETTVSEATNISQQDSQGINQVANDVPENSERAKYKNIPLETIASSLQGSDPSAIALNAFDDMASENGTRTVEVEYPRENQAVVTITQTRLADDSVGSIRYRVELSTLGRSLLVTSPRVWQVVWAGSQVKCWTGRGNQQWSSNNCQ